MIVSSVSFSHFRLMNCFFTRMLIGSYISCPEYNVEFIYLLLQNSFRDAFISTVWILYDSPPFVPRMNLL